MPKHGKYAVSLNNFYGGKEIAITSDKNRATYLVRRGELYHVYSKQNIDAFLGEDW